MKNLKTIIKSQFIVLLIGTIFAWANLGYEYYRFFNQQACELGCSVIPGVVNPIFTPCFYGAMFFMIALIHSAVLMKKSK